MSKPIIKTYENGSTIIYQKDPNINGYKVVLGFNGGAYLDGKYPGLSHLVEHLLFRKENINDTNVYLEKILRDCLNPEAFTAGNYIYVPFASSKEHIEEFLDIFTERFKNTHFTEEQIKKEIEVIKNEIELYGVKPINVTQTDNILINSLQLNVPIQSQVDLLGNYSSLKKITPEIVADYVNKYFNSENLIVSVVSNSSFQDVEALISDHVLSKFNQAKKEEYIIPMRTPIFYSPDNVAIIKPDENSSTVTIQIFLRERTLPCNDPELEYVYNTFEKNLLSDFGSMLYKKFRIEESLCYICNFSFVDVCTSAFKLFMFNTNKAKMNKVIKKCCSVIKEVAENGFDKEQFEAVRKTIAEADKNKMINYPSPSATINFTSHLNSFPLLDYDKIKRYIKTVKFEDFNEYTKNIYKSGNVSLYITGDFDSRKCYNLIEVEEMVGNFTHSKLKPQINIARREHLMMPLNEEEIEQWQDINDYLKNMKKIGLDSVDDDYLNQFNDLQNE